MKPKIETKKTSENKKEMKEIEKRNQRKPLNTMKTEK